MVTSWSLGNSWNILNRASIQQGWPKRRAIETNLCQRASNNWWQEMNKNPSFSFKISFFSRPNLFDCAAVERCSSRIHSIIHMMNHILKDKVQEKGDPLRGNILTFVWPCATHRFQGSDLRFYTVLFRCCSNFFYGQPRRGGFSWDCRWFLPSCVEMSIFGDSLGRVVPRSKTKKTTRSLEIGERTLWNLMSFYLRKTETILRSLLNHLRFVRIPSDSFGICLVFSSKTIILSLNNHQHVRVKNYGCRIDIYVSAVFSRFM